MSVAVRVHDFSLTVSDLKENMQTSSIRVVVSMRKSLINSFPLPVIQIIEYNNK